MRKSKLGVLVLIGISTVMLSSCRKYNKEDDSGVMKRYCEKYATEYEVVEKKENGDIRVCINAPDFKSVMEVIIEKKDDRDLTAKEIERVVEEHPDYIKEYKFWADGEEDDKIKKNFLDIVSEELIIEAIKNVEYTEEWSTEE